MPPKSLVLENSRIFGRVRSRVFFYGHGEYLRKIDDSTSMSCSEILEMSDILPY